MRFMLATTVGSIRDLKLTIVEMSGLPSTPEVTEPLANFSN